MSGLFLLSHLLPPLLLLLVAAGTGPFLLVTPRLWSAALIRPLPKDHITTLFVWARDNLVF
jgi:hypothetical protein